jgi:Uma2 family endonuclease
MTADELLYTNVPGKRTELVKGILLIHEPPGFRHGEVTARLAKVLMVHVDAHALGVVLVGDAGFKLESNPDTVRGPDVAFIRHDRVPTPSPTGYGDFAPDLVVEVLSPGDRPGEVLAKIGDWLSAGTRLVWVLDQVRRSARVYRGDGSEVLLSADDMLDGEDVVPGFSCPLTAIL